MKSFTKLLMVLLAICIITGLFFSRGKGIKDDDRVLRTGISVDEAYEVLEVKENGNGSLSAGSAFYEVIGAKHPDRAYLLQFSLSENRLERWSYRARKSNEHLPFPLRLAETRPR